VNALWWCIEALGFALTGLFMALGLNEHQWILSIILEGLLLWAVFMLFEYIVEHFFQSGHIGDNHRCKASYLVEKMYALNCGQGRCPYPLQFT
jgi:hypothetical protein